MEIDRQYRHVRKGFFTAVNEFANVCFKPNNRANATALLVAVEDYHEKFCRIAEQYELTIHPGQPGTKDRYDQDLARVRDAHSKILSMNNAYTDDLPLIPSDYGFNPGALPVYETEDETPVLSSASSTSDLHLSVMDDDESDAESKKGDGGKVDNSDNTDFLRIMQEEIQRCKKSVALQSSKKFASLQSQITRVQQDQATVKFDLETTFREDLADQRR